MRVGVAAHERHLEEQQARRPDDGAAAKPRQDLLGHERLDEKQEEGAEEDGDVKSKRLHRRGKYHSPRDATARLAPIARARANSVEPSCRVKRSS